MTDTPPDRSRRRLRPVLPVAVALVLLLVGAGLVAAPFLTAAPVDATPVAAERIGTGPADTRPADAEPGAAPIEVAEVTPARASGAGLADPASGDRAVAVVLADLEDFWAQSLDDAGPPTTRPAGGYVSMDSSAAAGRALCITDPAQIAGNAFYCPQDDGIVFDSSALVPVLLGHYGPGALAVAFAHEYGHVVQSWVGPTVADRRADPARYPAMLVEAQADCAAGAYLAWVAAGHSERVRIPAESLLRALTPVLDFRDPPDVDPAGPTAHGRAVDRLAFALTGFRDGSASCRAMTESSAPLVEAFDAGPLDPGRQPATEPRYPSADAAVAAAAPTIAALAESWPGASHLGPTEFPDPDPEDLAVAGPYGQFAEATTAAVAVGRGITGNDTAAACFAGAWTRSAVAQPAGSGLGTWPGDPDEALDLIRSRAGATFDDVAAFADGFGNGRCG